MRPSTDQKQESIKRQETSRQEFLANLFKEQNPEIKVNKGDNYVEVIREIEKPIEKIVEKIVEVEKPCQIFTKEEIDSIGVIFDYAKRFTMDNDSNLLEVLLFKKTIIKKLESLIKK